MLEGSFFTEGVVEWMRALPYFYEDDYAIYVHAGLPKGDDGFEHPADVKVKLKLLWLRDEDFFRNYQGKLVIFGHTATKLLPPELSMMRRSSSKTVLRPSWRPPSFVKAPRAGRKRRSTSASPRTPLLSRSQVFPAPASPVT